MTGGAGLFLALTTGATVETHLCHGSVSKEAKVRTVVGVLLRRTFKTGFDGLKKTLWPTVPVGSC